MNIRRPLGLVLLCLLTYQPLAHAKAFQFEDILTKALTESIDLKIAEVDKKISNTALLGARSDYFPKIQSRFTSEYQNDLTDTPGNVVSIGDRVLPTGTRYQNSLNVSVTQSLFTFGKRRNKVQSVKAEQNYKTAMIEQAQNELKFSILDLYQEILKNKQNLAFTTQQRILYQQIYDARQRLFDAGEGSKLDATEAAIHLAETFSRETRTESKLQELFKALSFHTGESYNIEDEFLHLGQNHQSALIDIDLNSTPELIAFDHQIEKKEAEIKAQQKEWLPSVVGYTNYNLFGFDPDQPLQAYGNLSSRSVSLGIYLNMPIFDGFQNLAIVRRLKLEAERLVLEKEKKRRDLQKRVDQALMLVQNRNDEAIHRQLVVEEQKNVETMDERLASEGLVNSLKKLNDQLETLQAELELSMTHIDEAAAFQKLIFFNGIESHILANAQGF